MSSAWTNTIRGVQTLGALALVAAAALVTAGCGPAPGYEAEARVPTSPPLSSEELAARGQGRAEASQPQTQGDAAGEVEIGADANEYADTDPSALTEFQPALEGHGSWVNDSTYGTVWVPAENEVGSDFVPYETAGHWTYDDETSWVWVSDYAWGWAPFHYGRWAHVGHHGWVWIPGRTYAGAWVVWRTGGPDYEYIGWAPMGPSWYWYDGYALAWTFGWAPYYGYCHRNYLYNHELGPYVVHGPRAHDYEAHTRPYGGGEGSMGGGRAPARPTVGTSDRVAANPTVGGHLGRTLASPTVAPRPSELGIRSDAVVPPPRDDVGLAHATALASPRTAVAQGGAAPTRQTRRPLPSDGTEGASAIARVPPRGYATSTGLSSPGASRLDAAARAPQVQGVAPSARPSAAFSARSSVSPVDSHGAPRSGGGFSGGSPPTQAPTQVQPPSFAAPSYHPPAGVAAPAYHPAPAAPGVATPSAPSGGVHPASGVHPSSTISSPTHSSAPSVSHPSAPARSSVRSSRK